MFPPVLMEEVMVPWWMLPIPEPSRLLGGVEAGWELG